MLIARKTQGHPVENTLGRVKMGDAREAFKAVHAYFHPDSQSGRTASFKQFYGATMANTSTNIIGWPATVQERARNLEEVGGKADETAQLSILLGGLLPEFEKIKDILEDRDNLTFDLACNKLTAYAQSHKLELLTKDGGKLHSKANTFNVEQSRQGQNNDRSRRSQGSRQSHNNDRSRRSDESKECFQWKNHRCRYGDKCKFQHVGPGGCLPPPNNGNVPPQPPTPPAPGAFMVGGHVQDTTMVCDNCSGSHHLQNCPIANVFTVTADSEGVDYVFMAQDSEGVDDASCIGSAPSRGGPPRPGSLYRSPRYGCAPPPHGSGDAALHRACSDTHNFVDHLRQSGREVNAVPTQAGVDCDRDHGCLFPQRQGMRLRARRWWSHC